MEDKKEEVRYDLDGQEVVTTALMDLINQYPGLSPGDSIEYATLGDSKGKGGVSVNRECNQTGKD